jgi:hypothetical protein
MDREQEERLKELVYAIDNVIGQYQSEFLPHNIAGVLLSRVTLLLADDPETGKGLVRYVWEKLDELEQNNPGNMI